MDAFATADELGTLLNRSFSTQEKPHITALLESASTYLRSDVIGAQIWPPREITFRGWPDPSGDVRLPSRFVQAVTSVTRDGRSAPFQYRDDLLVRGIGYGPVDITYLDGLGKADDRTTIPAGLNRWAMVLVSEALTTLAINLGLGAGGVSSLGIDDFRVAFADGGDSAGMQLSVRNIDNLRAQYAPDAAEGPR